VCLDPGWIPLGECTPLPLENCALVIPLSESDDMCLKMIALAYCEIGQKGFSVSDLMIAWEPRMCLPKVSHSQYPKNAPQMKMHSQCRNLTRNPKNDVPCLPLNWVGGESLNCPWMGQIDPLNLLRSCALSLNKSVNIHLL
jgi:hypothetical protein